MKKNDKIAPPQSVSEVPDDELTDLEREILRNLDEAREETLEDLTCCEQGEWTERSLPAVRQPSSLRLRRLIIRDCPVHGRAEDIADVILFPGEPN